MLLGWRQGGPGREEDGAEGKSRVPPCISPWQLEKGIARHIQELSSSNDTGEPEDVSTWPGPSWTVFFRQPCITLACFLEAPITLPHLSLPHAWGTGRTSAGAHTSIRFV